MPRSLPAPSPPVFLGPSIHCVACLSTIFLVLTSSTLAVSVGKFRGIPMNTHFSCFGAILCSRTLCRAYPTAPNGRKLSAVGNFPNHRSYGDLPPSVGVVTDLLVTLHAKSISWAHSFSRCTLMTSSNSSIRMIAFYRKSPSARSATPLYSGVSGGVCSCVILRRSNSR